MPGMNPEFSKQHMGQSLVTTIQVNRIPFFLIVKNVHENYTMIRDLNIHTFKTHISALI